MTDPLTDGRLLPLAGVTIVTALFHAVLPTHWLPFVLVGRTQGWSLARLGAVATAAAGGHALITAGVGFAVAFLAVGLEKHLERAEALGGGLLIAFGVAYAIFDLRHLGHRHLHHSHDGEMHDAAHHRALVDRASVVSLVAVLSLSPCVALTPVFFSAGELGTAAVGALAALNLAVTIVAMPLMTILAARGLRLLRLERLERHERRIVGGLLVAVGLAVIFLHHEH